MGALHSQTVHEPSRFRIRGIGSWTWERSHRWPIESAQGPHIQTRLCSRFWEPQALRIWKAGKEWPKCCGEDSMTWCSQHFCEEPGQWGQGPAHSEHMGHTANLPPIGPRLSVLQTALWGKVMPPSGPGSWGHCLLSILVPESLPGSEKGKASLVGCSHPARLRWFWGSPLSLGVL